MTDVPLPPPGDRNWIGWAGEQEDLSDQVLTATPEPLPNTLPKRDAEGRLQAVPGAAEGDVATVGQLSTVSSGAVTIPGLPGQDVLYVRQRSDGTWPLRPTSRTDLLVIWQRIVAGSPPPAAASAPFVNGAYNLDFCFGQPGVTGGGTPPPDPGTVTPPAPTTQTMLLGANVPGISSWADWQAREAQVGDMGIRRCFNTAMPGTWAGSAAAATSGQGMVNWLSVRPVASSLAAGTIDAQITNFVNSIPASETNRVMLTCLHEPENNVPNPTAATWKTALQRFYDLVKAANSSVLVGPVLMGYTFDPRSGRNIQDWNVGAGYCDFYGVDYYNAYHYPLTGNSPNWINPISVPVANFQAFCASIGKPGAFGELGTSDDTTNPQRKVDWVQGYIDYAHQNKFLGLCYFDSYKPGDTDPTIVLDSTPQFKTYWQSQCAAHPARTVTA